METQPADCPSVAGRSELGRTPPPLPMTPTLTSPLVPLLPYSLFPSLPLPLSSFIYCPALLPFTACSSLLLFFFALPPPPYLVNQPLPILPSVSPAFSIRSQPSVRSPPPPPPSRVPLLFPISLTSNATSKPAGTRAVLCFRSRPPQLFPLQFCHRCPVSLALLFTKVPLCHVSQTPRLFQSSPRRRGAETSEAPLLASSSGKRIEDKEAAVIKGERETKRRRDAVRSDDETRAERKRKRGEKREEQGKGESSLENAPNTATGDRGNIGSKYIWVAIKRKCGAVRRCRWYTKIDTRPAASPCFAFIRSFFPLSFPSPLP